MPHPSNLGGDGFGKKCAADSMCGSFMSGPYLGMYGGNENDFSTFLDVILLFFPFSGLPKKKN